MNALVVDDDPQIRALVARVLLDAGFSPAQCATADEGIEMLTCRPHDLRLVVTDISMPGALDGLDLAAHAVTLQPQLSVVVISGSLDSETRRRIPEGVLAVLPKPFSLGEFARLARAASAGSATAA